MTRLLGAFFFSLLLCASCWAQSSTAVQPPSAKENSLKPVANEVAQPPSSGAGASGAKKVSSPVVRLTTVEDIVSTTESAGSFAELSCDGDGNVFLGPAENGDAIRKINAKGELVASFTPEANPEVKVYGVGRYTVSPDGELYVPVGSQETHGWHLLAFKSDGSYSTNIRLDAGFLVQPATTTVFSNGNLLITGMRLDRNSKLFIVPFTGIFRSDGRLLKEITLEQDEHVPDASAMKDLKPGQAVPVITNREVAWGETEAAKDGNIYVMRWGSPVAFYAISAGGEVVKRFKVDPGAAYYAPEGMHIAGNRIAVMFRHGADDRILRVVDLDGHELANYTISSDEIPASQRLGVFACYSQNPERFTFLSRDSGFKLRVTTAEPR